MDSSAVIAETSQPSEESEEKPVYQEINTLSNVLVTMKIAEDSTLLGILLQTLARIEKEAILFQNFHRLINENSTV